MGQAPVGKPPMGSASVGSASVGSAQVAPASMAPPPPVAPVSGPPVSPPVSPPPTGQPPAELRRWQGETSAEVAPWTGRRQREPRKPPRIADQLFLLCHEPHEGSLAVKKSAVGLILAAGMLGELVASDHIAVNPDNGVLAALRHTEIPLGITAELWQMVRTEKPPLPLMTWIEFLAPRAREQVADRLILTRYVIASPQRRGEPWYPCAEPPVSIFSRDALESLIERDQHAADEQDAVILALAGSVGLRGLYMPDRWLTWVPAHIKDFIGHAVAAVSKLASRR